MDRRGVAFHQMSDRGIDGLLLRDPRLRYFCGLRRLSDLDSSIGTFGGSYKINRKYSASFFEQYDFDFNGRSNLITSATLTRKLPRWYASFTVRYDQRDNDLTLYITLWPEGIPEVRLTSGRLSTLSQSDSN